MAQAARQSKKAELHMLANIIKLNSDSDIETLVA